MKNVCAILMQYSEELVHILFINYKNIASQSWLRDRACKQQLVKGF